MGGLSILVAGSDANYALGKLCARGFRRLGHDVHYFDIQPNTLPLVNVQYNRRDVNRAFASTVRENELDAVFVIKGDSLSTEALSEVADESRAILCNWNPDNPFMARSEERRLETYLETLPLYDVAFIWTEELFDELVESGAQRVRHLPFGYDPAIHKPVSPSEEHESDVVFAGHWSKKRQRYLSALADLDIDLAIYGNYWKRKCFDRQVRRHVRDSAVFGEAYSRVLCSSKIALNVVADHNLEAYNMRSFEIPATGSFMATTRTEGQQEIFGEGEGMVCFETPAELQATVEEYIDSDRRATIAETGAERVEPHTYENRMETVVETVEEAW